MKIGITGLANSGKSTIFNALTGLGVETAPYQTTGGEPNQGVVKVPDPRVDKLASIFKPKKVTYATVHYVDYMGLTKGDQKQNASVCGFIKDAAALVVVVRAFHDDAISHPLGGVDPLRDVRTVEAELILGDMELVEKRLAGIEAGAKRAVKVDPAERGALVRCMEALEQERPLRNLEFTEAERTAMRHLQFMSIKPMTVALNLAEEDFGTEKARGLEADVTGFFGEAAPVNVVSMSGKIEMELSELPAEEASAFMQDLGIPEPAKNRLIRASYENLRLIPFFTVGEDEVRSWTISQGTDALVAAGKIHSDIQRGFIRAEVVGYEDLIALGGSMAAARDKGVFRLEGKTYRVHDGDIVHFRFNV